MTLASAMFFAEGLLVSVVGAPLALGKIAPNGSYGFCVSRTLTDPAMWYAVNRASGIGLVVGGIAIAVMAILLPILLRGRPANVLAMANLLVTVVALVGAILPGLWVLRG